MAMSFFMAGISNSASAYVIPETCQDAFNLRSYNFGLTKGGMLIDKEWDKIENNCERMTATPSFKNSIIDIINDLSVPQDSTDFVLCHYYGYMNGIADRLKELDADCPQQCLMDGNFIGEVAAKMYCELSIGFDGIQQSSDFNTGILSVCDETMTDSCGSTFDDQTAIYVNVFGDQCESYTQIPYTPVWETAKLRQCIFVP
jgi:hypothetical protein